ncbi:MAG TPA: hypothetical protein VGF55_13120, partial [Gemmataceae bacterium]
GSDDYRVREQATAWLWAAGPAAEDALKAGLKSDDAEVVARCRDLLDKIPYGITPDMPRRFVELIAAARTGGPGAWPTVAPDLLDLGPRGLDVADRLIDRLAATAAQRDSMRHAIDVEGWRVAPALLAAGQADRAGELLERSAVAAAAAPADPVAVRHYAAFLAARGRLADQLPRWKGLADKHADQAGDGNGRLPDGSPDGRVSAVILAHLAKLHGDFAEARRAADRTGRADLKEAALFDQGAWAELADLPAADNRSAATTVGLKLMYLDLAGKAAAAAAALDELKKMAVVRTGSPAPPLVFRALMFAGRPADALAALDKYKLPDGLLPQFDVLCQQHRYDDAFARLDKAAVGERTALRWQWDTAKLRVHLLRGEQDAARQILAGLTAYDRLTPAESSAALEAVQLLVERHRTDDALPLAAALLNGGSTPAEVFAKLYPKAPLAAETWWQSLRLEHAVEPMRDTVTRLPALLDKRLAEPAGRAALEAAAKAARSRPDADAERALQGLGEACRAAGLDEQARALVEEAAKRTNSAAAWLRLGDLHAEAKQYADAADAYERAWKADSKQSLPLWLRGWALEKAGRPGGPEARQLAHALPLADEDARIKLADELAKRSDLGPEMMEQVRAERRLVVRLGGPGSRNGRSAEGRLCEDPGAFPDRRAAAACADRFLIRMLRSNSYFLKNESYLRTLHRRAAYRARGLLAAGDVAGAVREAEAAEALLPGSDEPAESLVPGLAKAGHAAEADRLYAAPAAVLDRLCKDYPQSAGFHNDRAWLAARCRRDLDPALEHARKAVELAPSSANIRATLAEVLFQRGEQAAAVAEIKRCVELEPKSEVYAKRLRRIESGDRDAPVGER